MTGRKRRRFPAWWLGVQIGIGLALLVWRWLEERARQRDWQTTAPAPPPPPEEPPAVARQQEPDDLTRIRGIGPKYAAILRAAGVTTYARLAEMSADELRAIFSASGRVPDVSDWPAQARELLSG